MSRLHIDKKVKKSPNQAVGHRSGGKAARTGQLREPLANKRGIQWHKEKGPTEDYRIRLLTILRGLPPDGFERLCGAMQGRADKGIILTTGTFTVEAKKEARRDGAPQIELVDGDDLVMLLKI